MAASTYFKPTNFPHGVSSQGAPVMTEPADASEALTVPGAVDAGGTVTAKTDTAPVAGGAAGILLSSVANFGIFYGTGAPTISAAQGSLYLRRDGTGVGDRAYINTNGTTGWTAITTVA
jgi:hypothetical protein